MVALVTLAFVLSTPAVIGQTPPPAKPAKYVAPVKAGATIEVIQMPSKRVGKEIITVIKVRNTSKGALNLLKADEYWYDKKMNIVTGAQYSHKKAPIQPGEIVEITLSSPLPAGADLYRDQIMFRHAYGDVKATSVKEFK